MQNQIPLYELPVVEWCGLREAIYWIAHGIVPTTPDWTSLKPTPDLVTEHDLPARGALMAAVLAGQIAMYGRSDAVCVDVGGQPKTIVLPGSKLTEIPLTPILKAGADGVLWECSAIVRREDPWDTEYTECWGAVCFLTADIAAVFSLCAKASTPSIERLPGKPEEVAHHMRQMGFDQTDATAEVRYWYPNLTLGRLAAAVPAKWGRKITAKSEEERGRRLMQFVKKRYKSFPAGYQPKCRPVEG